MFLNATQHAFAPQPYPRHDMQLIQAPTSGSQRHEAQGTLVHICCSPLLPQRLKILPGALQHLAQQHMICDGMPGLCRRVCQEEHGQMPLTDVASNMQKIRALLNSKEITHKRARLSRMLSGAPRGCQTCALLSPPLTSVMSLWQHLTTTVRRSLRAELTSLCQPRPILPLLLHSLRSGAKCRYDECTQQTVHGAWVPDRKNLSRIRKKREWKTFRQFPGGLPCWSLGHGRCRRLGRWTHGVNAGKKQRATTCDLCFPKQLKHLCT